MTVGGEERRCITTTLERPRPRTTQNRFQFLAIHERRTEEFVPLRYPPTGLSLERAVGPSS